jgi:hypothetical protein
MESVLHVIGDVNQGWQAIPYLAAKQLVSGQAEASRRIFRSTDIGDISYSFRQYVLPCNGRELNIYDCRFQDKSL